MGSKVYILLMFVSLSYSSKLQTLYEYYTNGGIDSGLKAEGNNFRLNGKDITIFSGSFHYFRVHQNNWRPILNKLKAAGLNSVQLYSPWNLHEETPGHFDFESGMLNLSDFLIAIREADMFAMYRPGPYICAEWEFGGLPAWLLRDPNMKVRSNYKPYLDAIDRYWKQLFAIVRQFQFSSNGGPIIGIQIENEFGSYGNSLYNQNDSEYMRTLGNIATKYGITELLFTSDGPGKQGSLDEYFPSLNFNKNSLKNLKEHKALHPNRPLYVAEYWSGWFDNWGGKHNKQNISYYSKQFDEIVFQMNSSFNAYMFIGGTNFGFGAGNVGKVVAGALTGSFVTSYDYDAPLNESGNYTEKYWKTKELIEKFNRERNLPQLDTPSPPVPEIAVNYGVLNVSEQLSLNDVLYKVKSYSYVNPVSMENINIGPNYGQNFGFTLYRTSIPKSRSIKFSKGRVNDRAVISVNNRQIGFVFAKNTSFIHNIPNITFERNLQNNYTLDILVENMGRVGFGPTINEQNIQRKGLQEDILIDGRVQTDWQIFALDFKPQFIDQLKYENWCSIQDYRSPTFYRTNLVIDGKPEDSYIKLGNNWMTSIVFVNGFNLGRYWSVGPTETLYLPSPLLKQGVNEIIIFETQSNGRQIQLIDKPILG